MNDTLSPLHTFKRQFDFHPEIMHSASHQTYTKVVIAGMGGSAICVSLLKMLFPHLAVTLHNSYGLPAAFDTSNTLLILNSYSGNTEEILDVLDRGMKEGAQIALLSRGGQLLEKGDSLGIPYVRIPESDLEPRFSIGYQLIGLLSLMGEDDKIRELREKVDLVRLESCETSGNELAERLHGHYPVIYSSAHFYPVAYLIKAAVNEGAKLPCFVNQIPEANHNELQSFVTDDASDAHEDFSFLFIRSAFDHQRIEKRFDTMSSLFQARGFIVENLTKDATALSEIFETILIGYFMATKMATLRNVDPYKTPFIQEFKNLMSK